MSDLASLLAQAGVYSSIAGGAISAVGTYQQGRLQRTGYRAQAEIDSINQELANRQAADAIERGRESIDTLRLSTRQLAGQQRASLAARGVDLTEGSPLNILTDTAFMSARDVNTLQLNAAREAWGMRVQGANYGASAGTMNARARAESPLLSAGGSLLTSAGSVASRWYAYRKDFGEKMNDPLGDFLRQKGID